MKRDEQAVKRIISKLIKEWQEEAEIAANSLIDLLEKGESLSSALKKIKQKYSSLFELPNLQDALVESACAGLGIEPSILTEQTLSKVKHSLSESWTGNELVSLSKRVRGMGDEMSRTIVDTISTQMRANKCWIDSARALYDGYNADHLLDKEDLPRYLDHVRRATQGSQIQMAKARRAVRNIERLSQNGAPTRMLKASYKQLVDAATSGTQEELEKAVHFAVEEKSRYIAERIIRTENARAWADGFIARADADDDCIGFKWIMDVRHPVIDVCDMYADADLYGMGAGIFPKGHAPALPAHPHCLCRFVEVYRSDKQPKNQTKEGGREWLASLSDKERRRVLGIQGNDDFVNGKGDWRDSMRGFSIGKQRSRLEKIDLFEEQ